MSASELRTRSGDAIQAVLRGEDVEISYHGKVVAFLVPAVFDMSTSEHEPVHSPEHQKLVLKGVIERGDARS